MCFVLFVVCRVLCVVCCLLFVVRCVLCDVSCVVCCRALCNLSLCAVAMNHIHEFDYFSSLFQTGHGRHRKRKKHPKDFKHLRQEVGLPAGSRPPGSHYVFALGMHWDNQRDKTRLQMLQIETNAIVITVSESKVIVGNMPHLSCVFNTRLGLKKLARSIAQYKRKGPPVELLIADYTTHLQSQFGRAAASIIAVYAADPVRITVLLDYFWLANDYYFEKYGMGWLETYCHICLSAGANKVILPRDNGIQNSRNMEKCWQGGMAKA